jgi:HEPN domain-containing protein
MDDQSSRWLMQARHDLESARKNHAIELYDVAIVLCQQALEKALKALYIAQTGQFPPRVHSLERLADLTQMRPQLEQALLDLEDFYIRLRYPDFTGPMPYELAEPADAAQAVSLTAQALSAIEQEIERLPSSHVAGETPTEAADDDNK